MNHLTDQQLLSDYAGHSDEAAFAELVRRHVDLVFSAALRMVRDAHLAEDVTQCAFVALAENARQLAQRPVLSGWLHRTAQNLAANTVRTEVRRRAREQETVVMNELLGTESETPWEHIAPLLDAAIGELNESDRDAVLFRYFERKSTREMAQCFGISDEAAQKRVSRALEGLREYFGKHGLATGAGGFVAAVSANAVQAAPVGLAATIATAIGLKGAAATAATAAPAATNWFSATLLTGIIAALLVGIGGYLARQNKANQRPDESQQLTTSAADRTVKTIQDQPQEGNPTMNTAATQAVLLSVTTALMTAATAPQALSAETLAIRAAEVLPIRPIISESPFDLSNIKILVGISDIVCLGRIVENNGLATNVSNRIYTSFNVEIVSNVKGNLRGAITLIQTGGVKDGFYYRLQSSDPSDPDASGLLTVGATYMLTARKTSTPGMYVLGSYHTARALVTTNAALSSQQVLALAEPKIAEMKEIYVNEMIPTTIRGSLPVAPALLATNAFKDLPIADQARIKSEVEAYKKRASTTSSQ